MLLKLYADKRCVSVIELLLVRNLYEHGHPEPDPNVSVSFTPQQREAASNLFRFHRLKQTGAEWKSFQYAVLNGRNRTPIITTVYQARLVAEKVLNKGQTVGCCCNACIGASPHSSWRPSGRDLCQVLECLGVPSGSLAAGR